MTFHIDLGVLMLAIIFATLWTIVLCGKDFEDIE
jgi:hypothetical protein